MIIACFFSFFFIIIVYNQFVCVLFCDFVGISSFIIWVGVETLSFVGGSYCGSRVCGFVNFYSQLAWWVGEFRFCLVDYSLKSCWVMEKRGIFFL